MEQQRGSISESARGLTDKLRSDGRQQLESRKRVAAEQIEEVAHALSRAGEQLENQPTLAGYTNQIATSVSNLATRLRDGNLDVNLDLARVVRQIQSADRTLIMATTSTGAAPRGSLEQESTTTLLSRLFSD